MSLKNSARSNNASLMTGISDPESRKNLIEQRASDLLSRGGGLMGLLAPVSTAAQRALATRNEVVHTIHEAAAELVRGKAIADREVAEAESQAFHDQTRSLLLIRHREQNDELLQSARNDLIRGMTGFLEQKQEALNTLSHVGGDPDLKAFAASAIIATYNTGLEHLAAQHRHQQNQTRQR